MHLSSATVESVSVGRIHRNISINITDRYSSVNGLPTVGNQSTAIKRFSNIYREISFLLSPIKGAITFYWRANFFLWALLLVLSRLYSFCIGKILCTKKLPQEERWIWFQSLGVRHGYQWWYFQFMMVSDYIFHFEMLEINYVPIKQSAIIKYNIMLIIFCKRYFN